MNEQFPPRLIARLKYLVSPAVALLAAVSAAAQIYTFDPPGSTGTFPNSINGSGAITGYYTDASNVTHGFVRDPQGNVTSFDPPGSSNTVPNSINTSGAITGSYDDANHVEHGFVRDPQGNFTSFDPPGGGFNTDTVPVSINTSGAITGYYDFAGSLFQGFVRDPLGNFSSFTQPGSTQTIASGINMPGAITGAYLDASFVSHGFVRDPQGNFTSFDPPGSTSTAPGSINTSGAITGSYYDASGVSHGFARDPLGNITSIDPQGSIQTFSFSINVSGAITGLYYDANFVRHGFVRDPQGNFSSFDLPGSTYTQPFSINGSGAITGYYKDASFVPHGFVGTVPNGMDISRYTTPTTIPSSVWQRAVSSGVSNVMVQAWGGLSSNSFANAQLTSAQNYLQNGTPVLNTGASVLLTYFSNFPAQHQVQQAVQAVGSAMTNLKVMALDIEICCGEFVPWKPSTPYAKGAQITDPANHIQTVVTAGTSGSTPPAWNDSGSNTTDGTAVWKDTGRVLLNTAASRIAYIQNAATYIQTNHPNLKVITHTPGGKNGGTDWKIITGNCGSSGTNACPTLIALPLWDIEHKHFTAGDGTLHCGDGVAGLVPFTPSGTTTWQTRSGNQYDWGFFTTAALLLEQNPDPEAKLAATSCIAKKEGFFGLISVDLDYFDPTLFQ